MARNSLLFIKKQNKEEKVLQNKIKIINVKLHKLQLMLRRAYQSAV